jgi:hypothetical protein
MILRIILLFFKTYNHYKFNYETETLIFFTHVCQCLLGLSGENRTMFALANLLEALTIVDNQKQRLCQGIRVAPKAEQIRVKKG